MPPKKIKRVSHPRKHLRPKSHFPYVSLFLTIFAGVAWYFTIVNMLGIFDMITAMNAFEAQSEGWEAIVEAVFGSIANAAAFSALIATTALMFLTFLSIAVVLTILFIVGWTRKPHAW